MDTWWMEHVALVSLVFFCFRLHMFPRFNCHTFGSSELCPPPKKIVFVAASHLVAGIKKNNPGDS